MMEKVQNNQPANQKYANIGEAYAFLMKYAEQNGYTTAELARESYIDGIWNKESERGKRKHNE